MRGMYTLCTLFLNLYYVYGDVATYDHDDAVADDDDGACRCMVVSAVLCIMCVFLRLYDVWRVMYDVWV